jgi:hypothetical protein
MPEQIPLVDFAEARQYFESLVPVTDAEWDLMTAEIQSRAFTVANVTSMNALLSIYNAASKRFTEGVTYEQFQQEVLTLAADEGWVSPAPWRLENVFDTNIQTGYGVGRLEQHMELVDLYPYGEYMGVGDDRERAWHFVLHGEIHLMSSEFWIIHYCPWEFR